MGVRVDDSRDVAEIALGRFFKGSQERASLAFHGRELAFRFIQDLTPKPQSRFFNLPGGWLAVNSIV